jgi:hypothetical protein
MLSRVHVAARILLFAGLCGVLTIPAPAGSEDFANFPETGTAYNTGTLFGQDGANGERGQGVTLSDPLSTAPKENK